LYKLWGLISTKTRLFWRKAIALIFFINGLNNCAFCQMLLHKFLDETNLLRRAILKCDNGEDVTVTVDCGSKKAKTKVEKTNNLRVCERRLFARLKKHMHNDC